MTKPHEHVWRMVAHADGCHWFVTTAACQCGATLRQSGERDVKEDPYSAVWMDMDGVPEEQQCERCRALLAGAEPEYTNEVVEATT